MRNAILAAGVVAAGIAAHFGGSRTSGPAGPPPSVKDDSYAPRRAAADPPGDHPLAVLDEYLFPNERPVSGGAASATAQAGTTGLNFNSSDIKILDDRAKVSRLLADEEGDWPPARKRLEHSVDEALIVTIPDPLRTHLSITFDRHLEGIMLAAQDSGYTFDRFWLPWRTETAAESADPEVRKNNQAEKKRREQLPGLLLFRKDAEEQFKSTTLAIFLVGETPTSGLDRPQFLKAAVFVDHLLRKPDGLRILGPTYSGSFTSLDAALSEMNQKPCQVRILSGTVTAFESLRKFRTKYPLFSTTVEDDCHAIQRLRKWLPSGKKVAILAEDGTAYGQSSRTRQGDVRCGDGKPADAIISYPREIYRLRNAYQDDPALAGARTSGETAATRRQLIFPLKDSQVGRDTVPQFSVGHTPVTQESELLQVAAIIKRLQIQVVVVEGTNILDILFLSRFLREFCPDIRVVVLNPDLLFVHGTDNLDYTGILAVSVYPLLVPPLPWQERKAPLRPFVSDSAVGVYKAGLALLRQAGAPGSCDAVRVDDAIRPPTWLSVGSRGVYWPIAVFPRQPAPTASGDSAPAPTRPTYSWTALFFACTVLVLAYVGIYIHAVGSKRLQRWCSDLHPAPDGPAVDSPRRIFHLLTTLLLLAAYACLGAAPVYFAFRGGSWDWAVSAAAAILAFAALLGTALHTCMRFWRRGLALVLLAVACLAGAGALALPADGTWSFFFLRSVHLTSAVAPNLPLLMLVLVFLSWAWFNMQRLIFIAERDPKVPEFSTRPRMHAACLRESLGWCFFIGGRNGYLIFVAAWISTMFGKSLFGSLEGPSYDWVFMTLLSLAGASLLAAAQGYLHLWLQLRLFLEAPDLYPLRKTFAKLPAVTSWLWRPHFRKRSYAVLHRFLDSVLMLESVAPAYYPGLSNDITALRDDQLGPIAEKLKEGERETAKQIASAQERENLIADRLRAVLSSGSWSMGSSETLDKLPPPAESPAEAAKLREKTLPDLLASEAVALRYVALIRYMMLQLQNQLSFLTAGFILTAIALNCYPFQGEDYFRWWLTGIFIIIGTVVVKVFVQMSRDVTLSLLTDTKAGAVDGNFYVRIVTAGALPVLTIIASQFPSVGRFLFSWIQPALSALR